MQRFRGVSGGRARSYLAMVCMLLVTAVASAGNQGIARVLESSSDTIRLVFEVKDFRLTPVEIDGSVWFRPELPEGGRIKEKGAPSLPRPVASVMLPERGRVSLRVTARDHEDFPNTPVAPSKGHLPRSINPADVPYTFGEAYQARQWPAEKAWLGEPYILRDHRGAAIRVAPFQYFPEKKLLRLYRRIEIDVLITDDPGVNEMRPSVRPRAPSLLFEEVYRRRFLNYDDRPAVSYAPLAEQGGMLVIGPAPLLEAVQPLVDWKRQKGMPTTVIDLADMGEDPDADDIKETVQDFYDHNNLAFLLLVGDAEDVPTFRVETEVVGVLGDSDPTYAKLAGDDDYPDIFVGRFSGSTTQQIATMVERTLRYEKYPEAGGTWYGRATGIASDEGEDPSDQEHMNSIRIRLLAGGYSAVDQIYDPGASKTTLRDALNAGRGLINYIGHGQLTSWNTTDFSSSDVHALTNKTRWPFIVSVACQNGNFVGKTCFAETWLRATSDGEPTGALAFYGSTIDQDWYSPMTAQNEFNDLMLAGSKLTFGGLCFNASMKMMDEWGAAGRETFDTWTVFGDPSVQIRTTEPVSLTVGHPGMLSSLSYTVQVSGASGALAALSVTNHLLASTHADEAGQAVLTLDDLPQGPLLLTVTAFNAIPYMDEVTTSGPWSILATAGPDGTIEPDGLISIPDQASTHFVITADPGYYIAGVATNGWSVPGAAGLYVFTSAWNHVTATGSVHATFAHEATETAAYGTPVPWLRQYYPHAADLETLKGYADMDTDGDGMAAWQEFIALTDPTSAASSFVAAAHHAPGGGQARHIRWWAGPDRFYNVYLLTNLTASPTVLASNLTVEALGETVYTDQVERARGYYRVSVQLEED